MKTITITAFIGFLVAIPLIFGRRRQAVAPVLMRPEKRNVDANLLYDIDDFITN